VRETWVIIELFNALKLPLIVIGSWPDETSLKAIAWDTIIFTWWNPEGMQDIVRDSSWLINLTKESFWIWTVEALLMWVPVFWFSEWATSELVDEKCWVLVDSKDMDDLKRWLKMFLSKERDRKEISESIREKLLKYK
jgi:glycosyltransferase involved in cell wall biosynthesis